MTVGYGDSHTDPVPVAKGGYGDSCMDPAPVSKNTDDACKAVEVPCTRGPGLICKDLNDWLLPESCAYNAMLIQRPLDPAEFQRHVDIVAASYKFGDDQSLQEHIQFPEGVTKECLSRELPEKAGRLAALAVEYGLPEDLGRRIQEDLQQIGMVVAQLAPASKKMSLKLDIMGENSCSKWHRDYYVGRAIVTYNSVGTEFVADDNCNMEHMGHGCDDLLRDKSQIFAADVGDILFMKGKNFPSTPNGLVHRSPPIRWHAGTSPKLVMNRLLVKVDVN